MLSSRVFRTASRQDYSFKRFMALGNPMFVNRPNRPLPPIENAQESKSSPGDVDFITKHGGKVALIGFTFAASLIYRWFIGGKNRTELEEEVALGSPLHPYESNDLRIKNSMTCAQFSALEANCRKQFVDGYSTYEDFVLFLQQQQDTCTIVDGYVIDRTILSAIEHTSSGKTGRHPISFFLVALCNVVNASPDERIVLMFNIAKHLSSEECTKNEKNGSCDEKDEVKTYDMEGENESENGSGLYCRQDNVEALVGFLVSSYQIPYEKMIQESGVYFPFKLFRRKTSAEMVTQAIETLKPPPHKIGQLSVNEFSELLTCGPVCVWGECYRKN